jgi:hypothetical protein
MIATPVEAPVMVYTCRFCQQQITIELDEQEVRNLAFLDSQGLTLRPTVCAACDGKTEPTLAYDEHDALQRLGQGKSREQTLRWYTHLLTRYPERSFERRKMAVRLAVIRNAAPGQQRSQRNWT